MDDGTVFIREKRDFEELINKYWPSITAGVKKKLANLMRENYRLDYFFVSALGFDPNNSMRALDFIKEQKPQIVDLEFIYRFKGSRLHKFLGFQHYNNLVKHIRSDESWFAHLVSLKSTTTKIWEYNIEAKLPLYYPLVTMSAYCNKFSAGIGKYKVVFSEYVHTFDMFDGLKIQDLVVRIPKDNLDLANWGFELNICVGGDNYVENCLRKMTRFLFCLERNGKPIVMADIKDSKHAGEIMYKSNTPVRKTDPELCEEIKKFGFAVLSKDIDYLRRYITKDHMVEKARKYTQMGLIAKEDDFEKMINQMGFNSSMQKKMDKVTQDFAAMGIAI